MKRLTSMLALVFAASIFASAAEPVVSNVNHNMVYQATQQVSTPEAKSILEIFSGSGLSLPLSKKKWTIMVFMNGKNNLSDAGDDDMDEMMGVGSDRNLNVIVEKGSMKEGEEGASFGPVQRLYVKRMGLFKEKAETLVLSSSDKADMGDWKELVSFVKYAKKNFPAEKYMLVLWNHGSGWISIGGKPMEGTAPASNETIGRGIAYDDETGNHITTMEMRAMLKEIGGVDVLASDACLMADIAVNAEVHKYAPYVVGSEETEPGEGYNYTILLKKFAKNPKMGAKEAAIATVDAYAEHYKTVDDDLTTSAVESSKIVSLSNGMKHFVDKALVSPDKKALVKAYKEANRFAYDHAADLYDFMRIVSENTTDKDMKSWAQLVMRFIKNQAVIKNVAYGKHEGKAYGIAAYMPLKDYDAEYDKLMFAKHTNWGAFAKYIMPDLPKEDNSQFDPSQGFDWDSIPDHQY